MTAAHDGGVTESGRPCFVMELGKGSRVTNRTVAA